MAADVGSTQNSGTGPGVSIALIGPTPPPWAGMPAQVMRWARNLGHEGHSVRIVSTRYDLALYPVRRIVAFLGGLVAGILASRIVNVHTGSDLSFHAFASPSIILGRLSGRRVLVTYKGGEALPFLSRSGLARFMLRRAHAVLVPSGYLRDVMSQFEISARIVPNILEAPATGTETPVRPEHPTLLVTRNLEPIYSVETALRAFAAVHASIPAARLSVYGDGIERNRLERLCRDEGIDGVTFHGNVTPERVQNALQGATLFLNPSTIDNTPNSLLEALNAGVPVVSTDVGGVGYLVRHRESALLVPPRDHSAMADAALAILRDRDLAAKLVTNGRTIARGFLWPNVYACFRDALEVEER